MKRLLVLMLFGVAATLGAGCEITDYGTAQSVVDYDLKDTYEATVEALEEQELKINDQNMDAMVGRVTARTADDKPVTVDLEKITDDATRISVRVGVADEARADMIRQAIVDNL